MSAIALPDFMAPASSKKPLNSLQAQADAQRSRARANSTFTTPQYRIRTVEPGTFRRHQGAHTAVTRPAQQGQLLAPVSAAQTSQGVNQQKKRGLLGGAVRLTRKGRLVFRGIPALTLAVLIVLGALTFISPGEAKSSTGEMATQVSSTMTVMHGDSLWSIAAKVAPGQDNRDVINHIMQINDLSTARVEPGQVLEVPVYTSK